MEIQTGFKQSGLKPNLSEKLSLRARIASARLARNEQALQHFLDAGGDEDSKTRKRFHREEEEALKNFSPLERLDIIRMAHDQFGRALDRERVGPRTDLLRRLRDYRASVTHSK